MLPEAVAVIAFGVSWLIEGETFLKDSPATGAQPTSVAGSPAR